MFLLFISFNSYAEIMPIPMGIHSSEDLKLIILTCLVAVTTIVVGFSLLANRNISLQISIPIIFYWYDILIFIKNIF